MGRTQEFTDPATYTVIFDWLVTYQLSQGRQPLPDPFASRPRSLIARVPGSSPTDRVDAGSRAAGAKQFEEALATHKNEFAARNASQVYALRDVSFLFIERLVVLRFLKNIDTAEHDRNAAAGTARPGPRPARPRVAPR